MKNLSKSPSGDHVIQLQTRSATVAPATVNEKAREVEVLWTSGARVARYSWARDEEFDEELVVDPSAIRLDRLNSGAPFLESHRSYSLGAVLGVVVEGSVRIEAGKGYAKVRFSERAEVEPIWRDIAAGIIRHVSVGYRVHKFERTAAADRKDGGKRALYRAVDWEPMEISAVAIGADPAAGVRGTETGQQAPVIIERGRQMDGNLTAPAEPGTPPAGGDAPQGGDSRTAETIRALGARHQLGDAFVDDLIGRGGTVEQARAAVMDELARRDPFGGRVHEPAPAEARGSGAGEDRFARAMTEAIMHRLDPARGDPSPDARSFVGMSIPELAAEYCRNRGIEVRGGPARALDLAMQTRRAVGYHSTSDFPAILANVANLRVLEHYEAAASGFKQVSRERDFNDFREVTSARLTGSTAFDKVKESGEFTYGRLDDAGEKTALATFGKILAISRQALVNDAENAFDSVTRILGTGSAETEAKLLVALFEDNAGAGPTLSDGDPVFHASRGNIGTAARIDVDSLAEGFVILRRQKGIGGETISVVPSFLVVPPECEAEALQAISDLYAAQVEHVNPFARKLQVVVEPRLASDQRWYLAAQPGRPEALMHGYLRGQRGPQIDTRIGFEVDGMEIKGRLDFTAGFVDWRGWVMNPGTAP